MFSKIFGDFKTVFFIMTGKNRTISKMGFQNEDLLFLFLSGRPILAPPCGLTGVPPRQNHDQIADCRSCKLNPHEEKPFWPSLSPEYED